MMLRDDISKHPWTFVAEDSWLVIDHLRRMALLSLQVHIDHHERPASVAPSRSVVFPEAVSMVAFRDLISESVEVDKREMKMLSS